MQQHPHQIRPANEHQPTSRAVEAEVPRGNTLLWPLEEHLYHTQGKRFP